METKVKIVIGSLAFVLILVCLYLFIQVLPIIGLFIAIFGLIVMGAGINNANDEDCMYGIIFALFGLLLIAVGIKLNASIDNLGIVDYLKTFFNSP